MAKPRRRVVASAEEARMAQKAEQMKAAGFKSFDGVYGDSTPGSFDVAADVAAMQGVKMMTDEQAAEIAAQMGGMPQDTGAMPMEQVVAQEPPIAQPPAQKPQEPTQAPEADKEEPEGLQLSEDPQERLQQIAEALAQIHPNPPTVEMLASWKNMHGSVFVLNVDDHVFIYRYLKRQEHIQINANPRINEMQEHQIEEMLFDRCVLWPKPDAIQKAGLPAGAMSMVVAQIRLQSLFLDPAAVAQMTIKL